MKKIFYFICLVLPTMLCAQNLQVHYDFGRDRDYVTTTLEMFKPDEFGAFFFFVDMDYDMPGNKSMSTGYWEIARYIAIPGLANLGVTVQYNDGIMALPMETGELAAFPLGQAWLGGVTWPLDLGIITLNTELLYRQARGSAAPDMQFTFVWTENLFTEKLLFTGYFDYWTQVNSSGKKLHVFQMEPQLWYRLAGHLSLGGEVEISKNFIPRDGWQFMPTLGMKWDF
ncbi:MAG TPA: DUF5020 family protein [bacterium]|nr:DUF5020 family protein [bacterium]HPN43713.1 DUF5020 family protein [bacterium]